MDPLTEWAPPVLTDHCVMESAERQSTVEDGLVLEMIQGLRDVISLLNIRGTQLRRLRPIYKKLYTDGPGWSTDR